MVKPATAKVDPHEVPDSPYLSLKHIESNTTRIVGQGVGRDVKSTKSIFKAGDVLYGKLRPYLNKVCMPSFDGICSTDILVFSRSDYIDNQFLMRFLTRPEVVAYANHNMSGVQLPRISFKKLAVVEFLLPPRVEQDRIAAKVEELLNGVEKAKNHLERVRAILEDFHKAVLNGACSGRLTDDWREKHPHSEPAKQLLKQVKGQLGVEGEQGDSIDFDFELPPSWILVQISDFTSKVGSGATPRGGKSSYKAEGVPLIRSQNVHFDGFRDEGIAYLDEKQAASLDAATVEAGDVLLNITGASIGRVTQAPPRMHGARVNQHVCIIRPCRVVDPVW
ncbi:MAG: restriction endonuclease subunit S, partial [Thiotrichaceae bacterium]